MRQVLAADPLDSLVHDRPVRFVVPVESPLVRGTADHDHLGHGEVEFEGEFLGHDGDPPCGVPGPQRQQIGSVEEHPAGRGPMDTVDSLEDRRLPAAVRPEQSNEVPVRNPDVNVADDAPARDVHRQALQLQAHPPAPYR